MKNYKEWLKELLNNKHISYKEYVEMLGNYKPGNGTFESELQAMRNK